MIRTKGEAGTGDVVEAVKHMRTMTEDIEALKRLSEEEIRKMAVEMRAPESLLTKVKEIGRLPVLNFAAGFLENF